jgi:hypothetical protein
VAVDAVYSEAVSAFWRLKTPNNREFHAVRPKSRVLEGQFVTIIP